MSLALEVLEQRKQAGLATAWEGLNQAFGRKPPTYYMTNFGRLEQRKAKGIPDPTPFPSFANVNLPARMAPEAIPPHIQEAKNKSLANTQQIQNVMKAVQRPGGAPAAAPEPNQAERDARHATTMSTLKAVEASRTAPKLPLPPGPKVACLACPALDVLRLRAA